MVALCCGEDAALRVRPLAEMLNRLGFTVRILCHATAQDALAYRKIVLVGPTIYVVCLGEPLRYESVAPLPALLGTQRHPHEHLLVGSLVDGPPTELLSPILRFAESLEQLDEAEPQAVADTSAPELGEEEEDLPTNIRPSFVFRSASYPTVPFDATAEPASADENHEVEYDDPVVGGIPTLQDDFDSQPTRAIRLTEALPPVTEAPPAEAPPTTLSGRTLFYHEAPSRPFDHGPQDRAFEPGADRTAPYRSVAADADSPAETLRAPAPTEDTSAPNVSTVVASDDSIREPARRTDSGAYPHPARSRVPWVAVACASAALGLAAVVYVFPRASDEVQSPVVLASTARDPGFGGGVRNAAPATPRKSADAATPRAPADAATAGTPRAPAEPAPAKVVPAANEAPAASQEAQPEARPSQDPPLDDPPRPAANPDEADESEGEEAAADSRPAIERNPAFHKAVKAREIVPTERLYVARPDPAGPTMTWIDAIRQCEQEVKGDWHSWRLPYRRELKLLAAIGVLREGIYWSRTRDKTDRRLVYIMDAKQRDLRLVPYDDPTATTVCVTTRNVATGS